MHMQSNMTVPHRTNIALPRSRDSVSMNQGSLNWVNVHFFFPTFSKEFIKKQGRGKDINCTIKGMKEFTT